MSNLFQRPVEAKFITDLNKDILEEKYEIFSNHFLDSEIQKNIRNLNEEQYQGEFLDDLFVKVFGYKKNPTPNFNLTTEYKNVKDAKKADGAILINGKAVAVIELKGTDTTDLGKVESQAFGYKNNQPDCKYIITSNFVKLRFYIENTVSYDEFDLFNLTKERFALLYLCLSRFSIENDIPLKVKKASIVEEEQITKKLYKDYSNFKHDVYRNIIILNPEYDKLLLFKKSQKLLDRFLFIFFAEDKQLLPPNSTLDIINKWKDLKDKYDAYIPLIDRFRKYFNYLNTGEKEDIFAYNGGLFAPDEILDTIKIDDEMLYKHAKKLSDYDFATEVDVNILGHIFEHSLNELEELQAELEGKEIDKKNTKRKKDGVFYTPKHITKYIVENTVGKLCEEKKVEFDIKDEDFVSSKQLKTRKVLLDKLNKYRDWLLHITICDPACGSGAFLNQALEFLIKEHAYIDELTTKLSGGTLVIPQDENDILEHNLYGVDINEESVEIAKLSLWLRTARKGRKLSTLSNNIKCGNSLIDDPEVAGDKAFNWQKEFPHIFGKKDIKIVDIELEHTPDYLNMIELNAKLAKNKAEESVKYSKEAIEHSKKVYELIQQQKQLVKEPDGKYNEYIGGFDVVIGNPPYVFARGNISQSEKEYYSNHYSSAEYQVNTYMLFIERTISIIKHDGYYGLIVPNSWLMVSSATKLRNFILEYSRVNEIVNLSGYSFQGVNVETIILISKKSKIDKNEINIMMSTDQEFKFSHKRDQIDFSSNKNYEFNIYTDDESEKVINKIKLNSFDLDSLLQVKAGLKAYEKSKGTPLQSAEDVKNRPFDYTYKFDKTTHKYLEGKDVSRYDINWSGLFLKYGKHLAAPRIFEIFNDQKIIIREITGKYPKCINATFSDEIYLFNMSNIVVLQRNENIALKYVLVLLNSKLLSYYFMKNTAKSVRKMFPKIILKDLRLFPVKEIDIEAQQPFINKADLMLSLNKELQTESNNFLATLTEEKHLETIPKKLNNFYELSFEDFKKELKKKKITFVFGAENNKWRKYFNSVTEKTISIKAEIDRTDNEINNMVYELYGLTEEEIRIVEEG